MLGINLLRIVQEGHEENHRLPYETCMMFMSEGLAEAGAVGCLLNIYSLSLFLLVHIHGIQLQFCHVDILRCGEVIIILNCFVNFDPRNGNAAACPVIYETKNSVLCSDLVLRVPWSITPRCSKVSLLSPLLLIYKFIDVITLRSCTISFNLAGL